MARAWGRQTNMINAKLREILAGDKSDEATEDYNGLSSDGEEVHV